MNSRKVLAAVCRSAGVADDRFAVTCAVSDKLNMSRACAVRCEVNGESSSSW